MKLLLALLVSCALAVEYNGESWREQSTQHFDVRFQGAWLPKGLVFTIEEIHRKLEFNIGILNTSLLADKKKRFVLYRTRQEYLASKFKPPEWSQAIAIPRVNGLFTYEMPDDADFRTTLAHEMTHLFVGTYFQEGKAPPPRWLDEGLAMMMEDKVRPPASKDGYWENGKALLSRDRVKPVILFNDTSPGSDWPKEDVRDWYFQAYMMTRWLFLEHSKLQFKSFCNSLRDGQDLRYSLQKVYGISDLARFDRGWTSYAGLPAARPKAQAEIKSGYSFHGQSFKSQPPKK